MPPPGLQIYFRPRMTLTFDFLRPSCDTVDVYRDVCLPGVVKIPRVVLERNFTERDFL